MVNGPNQATLTAHGQITGKKNSRTASLNRRTGKLFFRQSDKAKAQEEQLVTEFKLAKRALPWPEDGEKVFEIEIKVFNQDKRRHDLDNQVSTLLDALVKAEILPDDNQHYVQKISAEYCGIDKDNPRAVIKLRNGDK